MKTKLLLPKTKQFMKSGYSLNDENEVFDITDALKTELDNDDSSFEEIHVYFPKGYRYAAVFYPWAEELQQYEVFKTKTAVLAALAGKKHHDFFVVDLYKEGVTYGIDKGKLKPW